MIAISGCCARYNRPTRLHGDRYRTIFAERAFASSLRSPHLEAWVNHRRGTILARRHDHTLGLADTSVGLFYTLYISDRIWCDVLTDAAAFGQLHGASVAWDPATARVVWSGDLCIIIAVELVEISLCLGQTRPQFSQTSADLRAIV